MSSSWTPCHALPVQLRGSKPRTGTAAALVAGALLAGTAAARVAAPALSTAHVRPVQAASPACELLAAALMQHAPQQQQQRSLTAAAQVLCWQQQKPHPLALQRCHTQQSQARPKPRQHPHSSPWTGLTSQLWCAQQGCRCRTVQPTSSVQEKTRPLALWAPRNQQQRDHHQALVVQRSSSP